jgi:hypothetical protein
VSSSAEQQFPRWFGRYLLLDLLAKGGMAEVYRARMTGAENFQRLLAIKCLRPELALDDEFTSMFIDEANVAAQLLHANIVQTYELGKQAGVLYIAMELVPGRDLRQLLAAAAKEGFRLPQWLAAYVAAKTAEGLDFAHRKQSIEGRPLGLVHRDVSPQNVLVSFHGEVKLLDFGIAKAAMRETATRAGLFKGNLAHTSPENVAGEPVDRRADIFGLGTLLFELLTGRRLFVADSDYALLDKVRRAETGSLRGSDHGFDPRFEPILERALARKVSDRYEWASEMADALTPILLEDGKLLGAKNAAGVMRQLFAAEIQHESDLLRRYAELEIPGHQPSGDGEAANAGSPAAYARYADSNSGESCIATTEVDTEEIRRRITAEQSRIDGRQLAPAASQAECQTAEIVLPEGGGGGATPAFEAGDDAALPAQQDEGTARLRRDRDRRPGWPLVLGLFLGVAGLSAAGLVWWRFSRPTTVSPAPGAAAVSPTPGRVNPRPPPPETPKADAPVVYGYVSIRVTGAPYARISIDGVDVGRAPLQAYRVPAGKHEIQVVEMRGSRRVKTKTQEMVVSPDSSRRSPARITVPM